MKWILASSYRCMETMFFLCMEGVLLNYKKAELIVKLDTCTVVVLVYYEKNRKMVLILWANFQNMFYIQFSDGFGSWCLGPKISESTIGFLLSQTESHFSVYKYLNKLRENSQNGTVNFGIPELFPPAILFFYSAELGMKFIAVLYFVIRCVNLEIVFFLFWQNGSAESMLRWYMVTDYIQFYICFEEKMLKHACWKTNRKLYTQFKVWFYEDSWYQFWQLLLLNIFILFKVRFHEDNCHQCQQLLLLKILIIFKY